MKLLLLFVALISLSIAYKTKANMFLSGQGGPVDLTKACNQHTKQKSKYLKYQFNPPLSANNPTWQINNTFVWIDAHQIPKELPDKGLFLSNNIRFQNSNGGYTGLQIWEKKTKNNTLFSLWDNKKTGKKAEPVHKNCIRNKNDGRSMGTKCFSHYDYKEGVLYEFSVFKSGQNKTGDFWTSIMHDHETGEETVVGIIFLQNDMGLQGWGGIKQYSVFQEHINCNLCDSFYQSSAVIGPILEGRELKDLQVQYNSIECVKDNVSPCIPDLGCKKGYAYITSGPDVVRETQQLSTIWGGLDFYYDEEPEEKKKEKKNKKKDKKDKKKKKKKNKKNKKE